MVKKSTVKKGKAPGKAGASTKRKGRAGAKSKARKTSSRPADKKAAAPKRRPGKTHLKTTDLKQFREMLLEKKRSLLGDMNSIETEAMGFKRHNGTSDLSNMPTHPADIGTDNYEQEFTLGLLESERVLLAEINEALQRIADKTYGVCQGTGKAITKARLRARPWARYGIEYARMIESGQVDPNAEEQDNFEFEMSEPSPPARKRRAKAPAKRKKK